jgi:hypothetical protein
MFEMQQITFADRLAVGTVGKQWSIHVARERDAVLEIRLGDKWKRVCRDDPLQIDRPIRAIRAPLLNRVCRRAQGWWLSADTFLHDLLRYLMRAKIYARKCGNI